MTPETDLTQEQRSIIDKVEKLLRLAGRNTNEAEAEAATAKAMALLESYNLDMSTVERNGGGDTGKRTDEKLIGGFYQYERDLWGRVAELNFCWYWSQHTRAWVTKRDEKAYEAMAAERGLTEDGKPRYPTYEMRKLAERKKLKNQHRLVGRVANVAATRAMAGYLLGTIERLARERLATRVTWDPTGPYKSEARALNAQLWGRWAVSYREGAAARIAEKLWDRRRQMLREEKERREAAHRKMSEAAGGTALTLTELSQAEEDGNTDFLYGEGTAARRRAERAENARRLAEADAANTAWAAANPKEAAAEEAKREKDARRRSARSYSGGQEKARDWSAYRAGYEAGEKIGLDTQAEGRRAAGLLG